MEKLFDEICKKIEIANTEINNAAGYRFLLGPKSTFSKTTPILLLDYHPNLALEGEELIKPTSEKGTAYYTETWDKKYKNKLSDLQTQIKYFMEQLCIKLNSPHKPEYFIDNYILSSYFIHFRLDSNNDKHINTLINKSNKIWEAIFLKYTPQYIIILGKNTYIATSNILKNIGYIEYEKDSFSAHYQNSQIHIYNYKKDKNIIHVGVLPHLSHFKLFSHTESIQIGRASCRERV